MADNESFSSIDRYHWYPVQKVTPSGQDIPPYGVAKLMGIIVKGQRPMFTAQKPDADEDGALVVMSPRGLTGQNTRSEGVVYGPVVARTEADVYSIGTKLSVRSNWDLGVGSNPRFMYLGKIPLSVRRNLHAGLVIPLSGGGSGGGGGIVRVLNMQVISGNAGSATTPATWQYTMTDFSTGNPVTLVNFAPRRHPVGRMLPANIGLGALYQAPDPSDPNGTLVDWYYIFWCNEILDTQSC